MIETDRRANQTVSRTENAINGANIIQGSVAPTTAVARTPVAKKPATSAQELKYHRLPRIEISGGILASLIAVGEHLVTQSLPMSACFGAAALLGWRLLAGTDLALAQVYAEARGMPAEVIERIMQRAVLNIERLQLLGDAVSDTDQQDKLLKIAHNSGAIMQELREHPEKITLATHFLDVYLDGTADVAEKFINIGTHVTAENSTNFTIFLDQAVDVCDKQQKMLFADEQLNLDVELDILQRRMRAELVRVR